MHVVKQFVLISCLRRGDSKSHIIENYFFLSNIFGASSIAITNRSHKLEILPRFKYLEFCDAGLNLVSVNCFIQIDISLFMNESFCKGR